LPQTAADSTTQPEVVAFSEKSPIFYYFEEHTTLETGRKVGRKIGVVQEILCKKRLLTSAKVRDCLIYEPRLLGRSGATHKVEFVLIQPTCAADLSVGQSLPVTAGLTISVASINAVRQTAVLLLTTDKKRRRTVRQGSLLNVSKLLSKSSLLVKTVGVKATEVRLTVLDPAFPVATIESKRVGAQRFSSSTKLGSGIQTIEKAKQASLVAVDFDLKYNGTLLPLAGGKA
jgi:hypothetical protein